MMLLDQVHVLRENVALLHKIESCVFPYGGSLTDTRTAYNFIRLILPARDIATMIALADPHGGILPSHLRGLSIRGDNGVGRSTQMEFKKFLGMIVHMTYFRMYEKIDVINDRDDRLIVPRVAFFQKLEHLIISYSDIWLVVCALLERASNKRDYIEGPGYNNLQRLLWDIRIEPVLIELIWKQFFAAISISIGDRNVLNNTPFSKQRRSNSWLIGWRRDSVYSECWVNLTTLVHIVREHLRR